jgi:hypothetical protein
LQPSDDAFDATTFTKNRQRLETHGLANAFFDAVVLRPENWARGRVEIC